MQTRNAGSACCALLILGAVSPLQAQDGGAPTVTVDGPSVLLNHIPFTLTLTSDAEQYRIVTADGTAVAAGTFEDGTARVQDLSLSGGDLPLEITVGGAGSTGEATWDRPSYPGWISLLPPLVAIGLALIFKEVVVSLFAGVWLGGLFVTGFNPLSAIWRSIDTFIVPSVADPNNASILVFSALLGGMVGVMSRAGGTQGIVKAVEPMATTPRRGQLSAYLAGLAIFFDDYANTLVVGNTFRPITDRLRISREKLAYIVDSTAAPVVAMVFVSTWVGFEISLIGTGLELAADQATDPAVAAALRAESPFTVFLRTIPYLFYPIFALLMVAMIIFFQRDFGPMLAAERRARSGGGLHRPDAQLMVDVESHEMQPKPGSPHRWHNAAIPVLTVVATVVLGLYFDGRANIGGGSLWDVFGAADPFRALLWGTLAGCLVAIGLAVGQRILSMTEAIEAWVGGLKAMMMAFVILTLAWSLGAVTGAVGTAPYLTQILSGNLSPVLMPFLVFVTAAAVSFATGTSWATMTIMLPLVIPLILALGVASGIEVSAQGPLFLNAVSAVLAGSLFGDHCSPISDTTVLSSMASACDHLDHVRTQLPYALSVAVVAMLLGSLGVALGLPLWLTYLTGGASLFALVRLLGRPVEAAA